MRALSVLMVVLVGCGGTDAAALDGIWDGDVSVTTHAGIAFSFPVHVSMAEPIGCSDAKELRLDVTNLCPAGGGLMETKWANNRAEWHGGAVCSPVALGGCSSVTLVYQEATLEVDGGVLTVHGTGTASGCDRNDATEFDVTASLRRASAAF